MEYTDEHHRDVSATVAQAWRVVAAMGDDRRRYVPLDLWRVRGLLDRITGGPGFRLTGPSHEPRPGDLVDFWQVESVEPPHLMRLRALTSLPGTARLEITLEPAGPQACRVGLRTVFTPRGPLGHAYWWSTVAAHQVTFALMTRRLASLIEAE